MELVQFGLGATEIGEPLNEIDVPTRSNCHFRELTHLWSVE